MFCYVYVQVPAEARRHIRPLYGGLYLSDMGPGSEMLVLYKISACS